MPKGSGWIQKDGTQKQRAARFLQRTLGEGSKINPRQAYRGAETRTQNRYRPILEIRPAVPSNFVQRVEPCTENHPERCPPARPAEENNGPEIIDEPPIRPVPATIPLLQAPDNNQVEEVMVILNDLPDAFLNNWRILQERRRALN